MSLPVLLFVVVILGVVAMVASGRGDGITPLTGPEARERAPLRLPDQGRWLTGEDLKALRLGVVFRGYRPDEVEQVLDRLAEELDQRDARVLELEERLALLEEPEESIELPRTPTPREHFEGGADAGSDPGGEERGDRFDL